MFQNGSLPDSDYANRAYKAGAKPLGYKFPSHRETSATVSASSQGCEILFLYLSYQQIPNRKPLIEHGAVLCLHLGQARF